MAVRGIVRADAYDCDCVLLSLLGRTGVAVVHDD